MANELELLSNKQTYRATDPDLACQAELDAGADGTVFSVTVAVEGARLFNTVEVTTAIKKLRALKQFCTAVLTQLGV